MNEAPEIKPCKKCGQDYGIRTTPQGEVRCVVCQHTEPNLSAWNTPLPEPTRAKPQQTQEGEAGLRDAAQELWDEVNSYRWTPRDNGGIDENSHEYEVWQGVLAAHTKLQARLAVSPRDAKAGELEALKAALERARQDAYGNVHAGNPAIKCAVCGDGTLQGRMVSVSGSGEDGTWKHWHCREAVALRQRDAALAEAVKLRAALKKMTKAATLLLANGTSQSMGSKYPTDEEVASVRKWHKCWWEAVKNFNEVEKEVAALQNANKTEGEQ